MSAVDLNINSLAGPGENILLSDELLARLRVCDVQLDAPDENTLILYGVATNQRCFNRPTTSLLLKRPRRALPFLICVSADLEYTGTDSALVLMFAGSSIGQGWRVLTVNVAGASDSSAAVESALALVGFGDVEPVWSESLTGAFGELDSPSNPLPKLGKLLTRFGTHLSKHGRDRHGALTFGRDLLIAHVCTALREWQSSLVLLSGPAGTGKSNILHAIARELNSLTLVVIDLSRMFAGTMFEAEREKLLAAVLDEAVAEPSLLLALEHIELVPTIVPRGNLLLTNAIERKARLVGVTLTENLSYFDSEPLRRRTQLFELTELWPDDLLELLLGLVPSLESHYKIEIPSRVVPEVIELAAPLYGFFPSKAIALLDTAASYAGASPERRLSSADVRKAVETKRKR